MKKALLLVAAFALCASATAQYVPDGEEFRIGHLDNGMSYYLCHNENPRGCADFYIAHNVGALQEEDSQNGLAHFLEHMAFNGTKHYPDKGLLEFLSKEGVRYGYNVNAYTSRNETVYNISDVPLVRESFIDSVLTVLHDWSCDISCDSVALDEERGVINEEWRLRDDQRYRMMNAQTGLIYRGAKHPERTVLGDMKVINSFSRADILDFYHKWYRPDLQAIIVVGDFDVDRMEDRIRERFSDITMPSDAPVKPSSYKPAPQIGALFEDMTDKAVKFYAYKIIYKQDMPSREEHHCEEFWRDQFSRQIVSSVLGERIKAKGREKDCPYASAVIVTSASEPEFYITLATITGRGDARMASAVEQVYSEISRMRRFGLSSREFEVARMNLASSARLDTPLDPRSTTNGQIVKKCYESFLHNTPCLTPESEQTLKAAVLASLDLESINGYCRSMFDNSQSIWSNCINAARVDSGVSAGEAKDIIARVDAAQLEPEYLNYKELDLCVDAPGGRITSVRTLKKHGLEEWILSNGARVYYGKCGSARDGVNITVNARFETGWRAYPQDNIAAGQFMSRYMTRSAGFRGVSRSDFHNYPELSGINVFQSSKPSGSLFSVTGRESSCENMFRVFNLFLSEPYMGDEAGFSKFAAQALRSLKGGPTPSTTFDNDAEKIYYGNHPWCAVQDSSSIESLRFEDLREQYLREFGDISSAKIFICSDLEREVVMDMVEKYVASLKPLSDASQLPECAPFIQAYKGHQVFERSEKPQSAPLCRISSHYSYSFGKGVKERETIAMLDYIMTARYIAKIREERGGAYHVGFNTAIYPQKGRKVESVVDFQTRPELRGILVGDVRSELERMACEGPDASEMESASKYLVKNRGEQAARASGSVVRQVGYMEDYVLYGVEYGYDYESVIKSITGRDIRSAARRVLRADSLLEIYSEE